MIKKYANRRLYNTGTSSYITLDHLSAMTKAGTDFKVVDAKSGDDITRTVLTQIIMDEEMGDGPMLPTSFLREIISLYGNQMQTMVPSYLEASMAALRRNQEQFTQSMMGAANPFNALAKQNMKMFEAAFTGGSTKEGEAPAPAPSAGEAAPASGSEIDALKAELAEMKAKLDRLG
ncbi:MAG: polyhydroxyalkanoate synthesis repressor PhaR [Pseudomonadota bacterium]